MHIGKDNQPRPGNTSNIKVQLTCSSLFTLHDLIFSNLKKYSLFLILLMGINAAMYGQIPVTVSDFEGHTGILIPRMDSDDLKSLENPKDGLLVYNTTLGQFFYYRRLSGTWRSIRIDETGSPSILGSTENLAVPHQPSFEATWHVEGNIGADQYSSDPPLLGTVDHFPLVFITDDKERMRIHAEGNIAIVRSLEVGENLIVKQDVHLNSEMGETMNHGPFTVTNQSLTLLSGPLTSQQNVDLNTNGGQTINSGPFTVANQSPTLLNGMLTVDQKTLLKLGVEVYGSTTLHGLFKVDNSYSTLLTGPTTISDLTQSATALVTSGAMVVAGGVGIGKNLNIGENLDITGASSFGGPVAFASPVLISAPEESVSTTSGALIVAGGVGITKRLHVGGASLLANTMEVAGTTQLNNTLGVTGATGLGGTLDVTGATTLDNSLGVTGATMLNSTLLVAGSTTLNSTLAVTGATTLNSILGVNGATTFNNILGVSGATTLGNTLAVSGNFTVNSNKFTVLATNGNTAVSGTLGVTGATNFFGTLGVTGTSMLGTTLGVTGATTLNSSLTVLGATTFNNAITINANPPGGEASFNGYPLKVQGGTQGVAIKVNGSRSNGTNFVSFWDDTKMWGRIEGQQLSELPNDPDHNRIAGELDVAVSLATINKTTAELDLAMATANLAAFLTSSTACIGFGACITVPIPSGIAAAGAAVAAQTANLIAVSVGVVSAKGRRDDYDLQKAVNIGVTYQSGAGDYAEWLPKTNTLDYFMPGFIVGLKNGSISLNTEEADKILAISTNPIVLGNMQAEGNASDYEKVAFMGQVPVHVIGKVNLGDYILPSGNNDGFAKAVHPSNMTPEDYFKVAGIAWSSSKNDVYNIINVAIGINDGDVSKLASEQKKEIEALHRKIEAFYIEESETDALLAQLVPGYKEALGIEDNEIRKANNPELSSDKNEPNDQIVEILPSEPGDIIYFDVTHDQIIDGINMAETMFIESGGDINTHPFWKRMKSNVGYREGVVTAMQNNLQKTLHTHKIINSEDAHKH